MEVSVIMPVYNAEKYVSLAIESVLAQMEVIELILVEDNSPDQALKICEMYVARDPRVILLRHANGENRGAGASRNLGIRHARGKFIAFLDADDQMIQNRFDTAKKLFETYPDADGVYGHIGTMYYDRRYKDLHLKRTQSEISGMKEHVRPEDLLRQLLRGNRGHISVDSLVVRREILTDAYLFDESLRQGQDTDFMYRLSSAHRLYAMQGTDVVALRGVHAENRVFKFAEADHFRRQVEFKCIRNKFYGCQDRKVAISVIKRNLDRSFLHRIPYVPARLSRTVTFYLFVLAHPSVALLLVRLKNRQESVIIRMKAYFETKFS